MVVCFGTFRQICVLCGYVRMCHSDFFGTVEKMPIQLPAPPSAVAAARSVVNSSYALALPGQRLLLMMIAQMNKRPDGQKSDPVFLIRNADYATLFECDKANAHRDVLKGIKELREGEVQFKINDAEYDTRGVPWLYARDFKARATVNAVHRLTIHPEVMPFLLELEKGFSKFNIADIRSLSSNNQVRLFVDCNLNRNTAGKSWRTNLDDFGTRYHLSESVLSRPSEFERKFLKPAIVAINKTTPLYISYRREGREFMFYIEEKSGK